MTDHKKCEHKDIRVMSENHWCRVCGSLKFWDKNIGEWSAWQLPTRPSLEPLDEKAVSEFIIDFYETEFLDDAMDIPKLSQALVSKFGKPRELDEVYLVKNEHSILGCFSSIADAEKYIISASDSVYIITLPVHNAGKL